MSNEIIIISTTASVTKKVKAVLKKRKLEFPVFEATMEKALEVSRKEIEKGTKVIVCRGGTTNYLRKRIDIPIVDIRHGFIDVYLTVEKAKTISDKIGVIAYGNFCEAVSDYLKIMKDSFPIAELSHDDEIEDHMKSFKDKGVEVIIGGFQVSAYSRKYGLKHVMGDADPASIDQSLNEAMHDLKVEQEREAKFETINAILNCTSEGIIAIESTGEIIHINEIAKKVLEYHDEVHINQILPNSKLLDTAMSGKAHTSEFLKIGANSIVLSSLPIKMDNHTIGAVATIQEEYKIQDIDIEIRKKNLGNGHFAKKRFKDIIGNSTQISTVIKRAAKYAKADSTVLIYGETGAGKEVFAQSIHNYSKRKNSPFVAVNCAALPENVLESELFGYVKGAFTGASAEGKAGIFELAHKGTVFLDEIGEISTAVQAKLLRVLQEKEVSRLGDDKVIPIDVRVLAATNKNLVDEIHRGEFREDLYFRLNVLELIIPPLKERKQDIRALIDYFVKEKTNRNMTIPEKSIQLFEQYDWPGNVRQLSNVIERLVVLCDDGIITPEATEIALKDMRLDSKVSPDIRRKATSEVEMKLIGIIEEMIHGNALPQPAIRKKEGQFTPQEIASQRLPDEEFDMESYFYDMEKKVVEDALIMHGGSRERTAAYLGISKATLWRKMKKLDIQDL